MDILTLAESNNNNLEDKYRLLLTRLEGAGKRGAAETLMAYVNNNWKVSINRGISHTLDFFVDGKYKNIYDVKKEIVGEFVKLESSDIVTEYALEKKLKQFFEPRTKFDSYWKEGKKFKYGALNLGSLGPTKYGECCVILKRPMVEKYRCLVFVKNDSLDYFVESKFDEEAFGEDIATKFSVHYLFVLKHEDIIDGTQNRDWTRAVCSDNNYIEAIIKDDIVKDHVEKVWISRSSYENYSRYLFRELLSDLSEPIERYQLHDFLLLRKLLKQNNISLEVVEDNVG